MMSFNCSPAATPTNVQRAAGAAKVLADTLAEIQADFSLQTPAATLIKINTATVALLSALDAISFSCTTAGSTSTNLSHHAPGGTLHGNPATQAVCAAMQGRQ